MINLSKLKLIGELFITKKTRALSQNVTNAIDCKNDTGLGTQCV